MRGRTAMLRLLPLLSLLMLSTATAQAAPNNSGAVFTWGGITYLTHQDGVSSGYSIDLGLPPLPDPATLGGLTVQATGPGGFSHTFTDAELYTWMGDAELWQEFPALIPGVYTFTVKDGQGHSATRKELLDNPHLMPVVDVSTIQKVRKPSGSYRFSWAPVDSDRPYYYRLTIVDAFGNEVYSGERRFDCQDDVASGILVDGATYRARVETHDAPSFDLLRNRSNSAYVNFTPSLSEYNGNRLPFNFAFVANRMENSGARSTDLNFSIGTFSGISSATVTGPGNFSYTYDLSADRLISNSQFYKNFTIPMVPGRYIFDVVVNGVHNIAYATLPAQAALPALDSTKLQARDLGNGSVRFSWAEAGGTGALYYRVHVEDAVTGLFITSPRLNKSYVDLPLTQLNTLGNRRWRVEIFDSSSGSAVRNRRNGIFTPLVIQPYQANAPELYGCQISHVTNYNNTDLTYVWAGASSPNGSITALTMTGPGGYTRDLLARNDFLEQGSPAPGLYTCSATDSNGKVVTSYNYQPAAHAIAPVDFRTVNVNTLPNGDLELSWAPVSSDVPIWYGVDLLKSSIVNNTIQTETLYLPVTPAEFFLSQTSLTIPAFALPGVPFLVRIYAHDGSDSTTYNNYSRSVTFAFEGAGFDYASLSDGDGDGYASNVALLESSHTLSVQNAGTGNGSVNSTPAGIACTSGSTSGCSANFTGGSVTLVATPGADSTFDGWSGICSGIGSCSSPMDANKSVTATFTLAPPVKIGLASYLTIQAANDSATDGAVIHMKEGVLAGSLVADRGIAVTIKGGYKADYSAVAGTTTIEGQILLRSGTVRTERVYLK